MERFFEHDRHEAAKRCESSSHDRSEAPLASLHRRVKRALSGCAELVRAVDQNQGVINHHASHRDDSEQGHEADG